MRVERITAEQTLTLRHTVLWPTKNLEFCRVAEDEFGFHYGGFFGEQLVGVASIFVEQDEARLRKFAVLPEYQGQGIGSMMLATMLSEVRNFQATLFWCDARESALGIYRKFGMSKQGERFYKGEIPYFKMSLEL
ncbi:GNAT family N-acetyltransferase [Vibrio europaeus]|uniref:GNAT family N-acetyltransferase n=1 Tax=Vibrio europaeus TaxID=300876 RepID=A0AAE7DZB0_9VIBR|nr:GNAT family N-acetyltransferase [Vibrio europaeus]MDC5806058.1 GNAT family N-acetyltransferase [Vibrio europaeus]MDC5825870.1 GNAT family N-acetyltransferase [Vibrio europaeus]MDC5831233.1 GNAT family N-acetyltransferase [Vibrio europaeus]MDC5834189.1 GNAT family N-acetyltransferase [Vibrio europaeus]QJY38766.1 GNAT family N-acetyltransferase [Vibrio europaeus]